MNKIIKKLCKGKQFDSEKYWNDRYNANGMFDSVTSENTKELIRILDFILKEDLPYQNIKSVLEIGCGLGQLGSKFKNYMGIDIAEYPIRIASVANPTKKFIIGNLRDMPQIFEEDKFDLILSIGVLMCIPFEEIKKIAEQMKKMSKYIILCENSNFQIPKKCKKQDIYNYPHDYHKLFNVKKKFPWRYHMFYVIEN